MYQGRSIAADIAHEIKSHILAKSQAVQKITPTRLGAIVHS